jgi:hypothetical protein
MWFGRQCICMNMDHWYTKVLFSSRIPIKISLLQLENIFSGSAFLVCIVY